MNISNLQYIAHFCRYTMKNYMIYFKIKNLIELLISEKTNIQVYLSKANQNMSLVMLMIAFSYLNAEKVIESQGKQELIFIHLDHILFFKYWWKVILLMKEECYLEESLIFVTWQEARRFIKRRIWVSSSFLSSRLLIWVFRRLERLFQLWLRAKSRIIFRIVILKSQDSYKTLWVVIQKQHL